MPDSLLRGVFVCGMETPSPIQRQAMPAVVQGKDVLCIAQSGTGKTTGCALALLSRVDPQRPQPQALILCPHREWAYNIFGALRTAAAGCGLGLRMAVGGTPLRGETEGQVVIGTPGRVLDLVGRRVLEVQGVRALMLDEMPDLVGRGFLEQIRDVVQQLDQTVQVVVTSAPSPCAATAEFVERVMHSPVRAVHHVPAVTLDGIRQFYVDCEKEEFKTEVLLELWEALAATQGVVFCNTARKAQYVAGELAAAGVLVSSLHAGIEEKNLREEVNQFRCGSTRVLVATDDYKRMIDVAHISVTVHYDFPTQYEGYLHRIGRSGEFGRQGVSIALLTTEEHRRKREVEQFFNVQVAQLPMDVGALL